MYTRYRQLQWINQKPPLRGNGFDLEGYYFGLSLILGLGTYCLGPITVDVVSVKDDLKFSCYGPASF